MPKLRTYKLLNCNVQLQAASYVKFNLTISQRSVLAKMRTGTFPLNIETGRYRGIAVENRLCELCDGHQIENEKHFVLHCPAYKSLRDQLMQKN